MSVTDFFDDPRPETRASLRRQRRRGPNGVLLAAMAIVAIAILLLASLILPGVISRFTGSSDYPGPGTGSVSITVPKGATGTQIAEILAKADVVKSSQAYVEAATADTVAAAKVQAGTYAMKKEMKASDALSFLANPANANAGGITIPEGQWVSEIIAKLSSATGVPKGDYEKAMASGKIGLPDYTKSIKGAKNPAEGWLFPSTYQFTSADSAEKQLSTMVAKTKEELKKAGVAEDKWEHVLTIASIVEAEAASADRGKVARVIINRVDDPTGPTQGRLQMDGTQNYAIQKRGLLNKAEVDAAKRTPFDTQERKGFPPTPVNNPGALAIEAAANPTKGPWLYFVTVNYDTGETLFTDSYQQFLQDSEKRTAWCSSNAGKC